MAPQAELPANTAADRPHTMPDGQAMVQMNHFTLGPGVQASVFCNHVGTDEVYLTIEAPVEKPFPAALKWLTSTYRETAQGLGLGAGTLVFSRLFLSDIANQTALLADSALRKELGPGAVSLIEQRPLSSSTVSLISYHVRGTLKRTMLSTVEGAWQNGCMVEGANYRMHWATNYACGRAPDSAGQTGHLLAAYNKALGLHGLNLREHTLRTWVYVRDIDNNYKGMVDARREYFDEQGLTESTRYIASTGIEGIGPEEHGLVTFDALSVGGITQEQIVRMEAIDHMPPTISYGVTFERGLRLQFGDRSHLYVSGTASIDSRGQVMYVGDAVKQAGKMLENVHALLEEQGAGFRDLAYVFLYVRNPADARRVLDIVQPALPHDLPLIAVHGSVCRPTWLVEIEGVAITGDRTGYPVFL